VRCGHRPGCLVGDDGGPASVGLKARVAFNLLASIIAVYLTGAWNMLKKSLVAAAAAGLALLPIASPASAAVGVKVGVLTCNVGGGSGFVFGSTKELSCTFSGRGRVEHYVGTISKYGVDIGYLTSGVILWAVLAPTHNPPPQALAGEYGGLTAGASAGVGASGNLLVGGSSHQISLQPLSVGGEKGINLAAVIAELSLKPAS
jgi:hypothetical protein